ncbi:AraC family transcriptional regulator [Streptomyces sp. AV19]|uniref:AraC family transcriptional regulator n=1 Tax=Streptomyces sp. AV19 TaxID=2793068 RepID=UPI0018FE2AE9|nr:AraC family transcriptional regulator [Streptomyces sp. AV19]MBH1937686.1 AraC family transcriptional regulator [Streptomyces sp. AV19]MDG4536354.1 AraC family transcriptional regulator [Streptomyces sp. AV19]
MDVFSDVIDALRTGRPRSSLTEHHGPWRVEAEEFPGAAFHVVLRGAGRLALAGEEVALSAGDAVFLPHGGAHVLAGDACGPTVLLSGSYELDLARAHPLLADIPGLVHVPSRQGPHPALHAAVALLGDEFRAPAPGTDAAVPLLLDLLLLYLMRAWYERSPRGGTGWCRALADPAVGRAVHAMHDEPSRAWTVAGLATVAGLSRAAFARRFASLVGRPPLTYLTWWRLTLAARLLRTSDAPLAAVAQRVGYASQFAFATAFRRAYGTAPGRYRTELGAQTVSDGS